MSGITPYDPHLQQPFGEYFEGGPTLGTGVITEAGLCATVPKWFAVFTPAQPHGHDPTKIEYEQLWGLNDVKGDFNSSQVLRRGYVAGGAGSNLWLFGQDAFFRLSDEGRMWQSYPRELYAFKSDPVEDWDYLNGGRQFETGKALFGPHEEFCVYWGMFFNMIPLWPWSGSEHTSGTTRLCSMLLRAFPRQGGLDPNRWRLEVWDYRDVPSESDEDYEPFPTLVARWGRHNDEGEFVENEFGEMVFIPPTDTPPFVWNEPQKFVIETSYPDGAPLSRVFYITPYYP